MDKKQIEKLRQKYIKNPPDGMTEKLVKNMTDSDLLDMHYFLIEDDDLDDDILPATGSLKPNAQRDAVPATDIPSQNAKHMPMDCGIFGFLKQLLYAWDTVVFLGLFDPIPNQDMEVPFFIDLT